MAPVLLSLEVAVLASLMAGSLGVAVAGLLSHVPFRGRVLVDALLTSPLVLPPTVLGYFLLVVIGRHSALGESWEVLTGHSLVFSRSGAVLAACVTSFPFVLQGALAAFESVDPVLLDAARTLGASRTRTFLKVTLPLAARGVVAGLVLGFARALGDFGATLLVAGNIPGETQTAALVIYDAILDGRTRDALPLVLVMTVAAVVLMVVAKLLGARASGARP